VNVKTCCDRDEFELISRTWVLTDCTVMRNNNIEDSILGKNVRAFSHSLPSI
jgi:hypothetical protein